MAEFETVDISQLQALAPALNNLLAHALPNGKMGKMTETAFATFLAPYVSTIGASGYIETTGSTLPTPSGDGPYFSLTGSGVYSGITANGDLNIWSFFDGAWSLTKEIFIDLSSYVKNESLFNGVYGNMLNISEVLNDAYINGEDGNITAATGFITSGNIPCQPLTQYFITGTALNSFNRGIVYKDAELTKVGFGYYGGEDGNQKPYFSFTTPSNAFYFQLTLKTSLPSDDTDVTKVSIGKGNFPADLSINYDGIISIENNNILGISNKGVNSKNRFNPDFVFNGYIDGTSGIRTSDPGYKTSGIIAVEPNTYITISGLSDKSYDRGFVYRNNAGNIISYGYLKPDNRYTLLIPSNSYFIELTLKTGLGSDNTDLSNVQIEKGATSTGLRLFKKEITSIDGVDVITSDIKTKGKKVLLFGDSITTTTGQTNWPTYAKVILELKDVVNYATAGAAYRDRTGVDDLQKISYQISQAISVYGGYDPDIIIINCGVNDGTFENADAALLGDYSTAMSKTTLSSLDRTKYFEALRWAFWSLKDKFKNAVCFACTPLQQAFTDTDRTDINTNAIIRMANRYNFFVIDQNKESGIIKDFEVAGGQGRYLADGLHPDENGKKLQARFLSNKILNSFN